MIPQKCFWQKPNLKTQKVEELAINWPKTLNPRPYPSHSEHALTPIPTVLPQSSGEDDALRQEKATPRKGYP